MFFGINIDLCDEANFMKFFYYNVQKSPTVAAVGGGGVEINL
jgi:hypothetical protein